jgi:hypothetical protein
MKRNTLVLCAFLAAVGISIQTAEAGVVFEASGTSAKGVDVSFKAELSILDDILTIFLTNTSPMDSLNPDDTLSSFYFDIVNGDGDRPVLTYTSAFGDVYRGSRNKPDTLVEADADILAVNVGDNSWQFKPMDADYMPRLGFGIGTVGNSNLSPNGFNGNIVDGMDYSIYKGEITTQNMNGKLLVKETATFTFALPAGGGFTENDISRQFAFGLGTKPDMLLTPEPATLALLGLGTLLLNNRIRR